LAKLFPTISIAQRVLLMDNSGEKLVFIYDFEGGLLKLKFDNLYRPNWYLKYVVNIL